MVGAFPPHKKTTLFGINVPPCPQDRILLFLIFETSSFPWDAPFLKERKVGARKDIVTDI